ncbi:GNAT family N-acetyltransferase [Candidatus Leptofilum sp.]|uniref:GNAT family N-acetyltransferase n=1 Tax=Candidatus Leptofilum sp. TaxID=3241576 RepID=UPI003B5CBCC0
MTFFGMNPTVVRSLVPETSLAYGLRDIVIRPGTIEDVDLIMAMHERLSDASLHKRYHRPWRPSRDNMAWVCKLHGENGRLLVAELPGSNPQIVGMAYYVAADAQTAEAAFLVEDRFQGQGLGKQLVQALVRQAVAQGICFFDAYVLTSNRSMLHLLQRTGKLVYQKLDMGTYEMRVRLAA